MIDWLDVPDLVVARVGGKALSLNRLSSFGFRIPPGFCLTTDAYAAQLATIAGGDFSRSDPSVLADESTRAALAGAMVAGPLVPTVAEALAASLHELGTRMRGAGVEPGAPPRLAVRSSGVAEDGAGASFAGLHDTELGVTADEVAPAVLRCWASLWSQRAVAYRTRRGLPLDGGAMAIIVQDLVPAVAAAVAFTRHPVTGRTDQILITTAPGLGEAMVSGEVTPDTIVVDKADRAVAEFTPGDSGAGPVLDDVALAAFVDLCLGVERSFGAPADIEAAIAADGWYLLQARPITTP
jgi:pyruvate,water dikinase